MPTFTYRAVASNGESQSGTMEASDRRVVMQRLQSKKLRPLEIVAKGGTSSSTAMSTARDAVAPVEVAGNKPAGPQKILEPDEFAGDKTATAFLKKLYQLHFGGMSLGDSIRLLSVRVTDPRQASLAARLWKDLSEGRTLAVSMRNYPKTFDAAMINLIEAGESTGNLVPVLDNLISHLEERAELQKKIKGGLIYPIFICTLALGVMLLFLFFLLPRIKTMMASMGGEMTGITKLLITISESIVKFGPWMIVLGVIGGVLFFQWRKKPDGRAATDGWFLKIPMIKNIVFNSDICRISNLCATLLESGLNTTETLRMTEKSVQNTVLQARFSAARTLINDGASFSNAFRRYGVLPDLDLDLMSVGENTGNIAKSFREIYRNHSRELSEQFKFLTVAISTGALGAAFSLVAILALGIVSSVLKMSQSLSSHH